MRQHACIAWEQDSLENFRIRLKNLIARVLVKAPKKYRMNSKEMYNLCFEMDFCYAGAPQKPLEQPLNYTYLL